MCRFAYILFIAVNVLVDTSSWVYIIKQSLDSVLYRVAKIVTVENFIILTRRENEPSFKNVIFAFVRTHPNLGLPMVQSHNSRGITGDCPLAAPTDFIRDISAGKLDFFRLDFVSVSDERGSTSRQK